MSDKKIVRNHEIDYLILDKKQEEVENIIWDCIDYLNLERCPSLKELYKYCDKFKISNIMNKLKLIGGLSGFSKTTGLPSSKLYNKMQKDNCNLKIEENYMKKLDKIVFKKYDEYSLHLSRQRIVRNLIKLKNKKVFGVN